MWSYSRIIREKFLEQPDEALNMQVAHALVNRKSQDF
jgi:hypothetical protein